MTRHCCCIIQFDCMDTTGYLFRVPAVKFADKLRKLHQNFLIAKNLMYQIDGAKVGFPQLLLRLLICKVLVSVFAKNCHSAVANTCGRRYIT